jgi:hypothetical protein
MILPYLAFTALGLALVCEALITFPKTLELIYE